MIISIHQPHFFPWLGYLDRMRRCDLFVLLDHVQFERQNYQNRVPIKTPGGPRWWGVPVRQCSRSERIIDKRIDDSGEGRRAWWSRSYRTLEQSYVAAPFFSEWAAEIRRVLDARPSRLVDLNAASLELLRDALGIRTPLARSSELDLRGHRADLVLEICQAVRADAFLGGVGASRRYLDPSRFRRAGIDVLWHEFNHPHYVQHPLSHPFLEGVSTLDLLFNCGAASRRVLEEGKGERLLHVAGA